jgi:NAD(P)-dependent dehydrogenase (short-subunit alcohol dehydrogenase family)
MQISETERSLSSGRLSGRSALILGAGSGIGRAVAEAFVGEGAGVVAFDLSAQKCASLSAALPTIKVIEGDACDRAAVGRVSDVCRGIADGLDVLVNCVGIFDFYKALGEIDADKLPGGFDDIFRVNVLSGLIATHTCLPMLQAAKGVVILTASSSGFYPGRGGVLYVASKFAIRGCVAALASELAPDVRVNGVAPGGVLGTDIRGSRELGLESMRMRADEERIADLEALAPLRIALTAQEIAQSYVFLASDAARGMTGEFLHPDGGLGIRG